MLLTIYSLNKIEYKAEVVGFNVKTSEGELTLLSGHLPLITTLAKGTAQILTIEHKKVPFEIKNGFLEMSEGDRLNVMVD